MNYKNPALIRKVLIAFIINLLILIYWITMPMHSQKLQDSANKKATEIQLEAFKNCSMIYFRNSASLPVNLNDLVTNPGNDKKWRQLLEEIPTDPWGNDYTYAVKDKIVIISSQGPTENQKDDLSVSFPKPQKEK